MTPEQWQTEKEASAARYQEQVDEGTLAPVDMQNPAHQRLMAIAMRVGAQHGVQPKIYFVPAQRHDDEAKQLQHMQQSLSQFSANAVSDTVIIPEVADKLFTPGETEAVLTHEFDHLCNPDMLATRMDAFQQFKKAQETYMRSEHSGAPDGVREELKATRDQLFEQVSDIATRFEVSADNNVVEQGKTSDFISALQKMTFARHLGERMDLVAPQEAIEICSEREAAALQNNMEAAANHTRESFVERLARLEQAVEQQESQAR